MNRRIVENYRDNARQMVYCDDQQWCDGRHLKHPRAAVPECKMRIPQFWPGTNRYVTQEEARQWCAESAYDSEVNHICSGPPRSAGGQGWECVTWEPCMKDWLGHRCQDGCEGACKKCWGGRFNNGRPPQPEYC